jgi:hypothetical protein
MFKRYLKRRDTAANWTSENPILLPGETGYETDTRKSKTGDGTTAWNSLAYDGGADVAVDTAASASKTTPVDADLIPLVDSEASNVLKKLTWSNLKATLKTYFDTLYQAAGTLAVTLGGTGRTTSSTAYGIITAGTTATGAHQTLPAGLLTQVLVGGGASAVPVWTTATGEGSPVRATSPILVNPALGTPSSGVVTNLTGTAAININGTVGATTPNTIVATRGTFNANGSASVSSLLVSGSPFAGTGTTSFPLVYVADSAATPSSTLNTAGCYLGVNGNGTKDLMRLDKDGLLRFSVDSSGNTTTTGIATSLNCVSLSVSQALYFADVSNSIAFIHTDTDSTHAWTLNNRNTTKVPFSVKGVASQSANLQEWQNSSGTVLASISSAGLITVPAFTCQSSNPYFIIQHTGYGGAGYQIYGKSNGDISYYNGSSDRVTFSVLGNLLIATPTDSGDINDRLQVSGGIALTGRLTLGAKTIATLPSAASSAGHRYRVTDSATITNRMVFSNGTAWYYEGTAVAV